MQTLSPLQKINHPLFNHHNIDVSIKRDDLIHPIISGNKWRKLKQNLVFVREHQLKGVLSFGGSYSNHIHALAFAAKQNNIKSVGVIRGEPDYAANFTLSWAQHWAMTLKFVNREKYRLRVQSEFIQQLQQEFPNYHIVPEGGSNHLALGGMADVITELNHQTDFDTLITPVGSGGTLAGLIAADNNQHQLLGIAVLKQASYLNKEVKTLLPEQAKVHNNWQIMTEFHDGGYGKFSTKNSQIIRDFIKATAIEFEPIYSGKMLAAFLALVQQGYFPSKQKIVLLHTGGLQGLGGLAERQYVKADEWPLPPVPPAR